MERTAGVIRNPKLIKIITRREQSSNDEGIGKVIYDLLMKVNINLITDTNS
jgi:hypothetical protein